MTGSQLYFVLGNAREGQEDAYNEWYDNVHLPEVLAMPGVLSAQRFSLMTPEFAKSFPAKHKYLAIYEFEGDADEVMAGIRDAAQSGQMVMHEGLELETVEMSFWEARGPKIRKHA